MSGCKMCSNIALKSKFMVSSETEGKINCELLKKKNQTEIYTSKLHVWAGTE